MSDRYVALVSNGAAALLRGMDPIRYLDLSDPMEIRLADDILVEADKRRSDELEAILKRVEVAVQNGVAKAFGG